MIRKAEIRDLEEILQIYEAARNFMAANGNPGQWVNGYPTRALVEEDLKKGQLYVYETEEGIEAAFVFFIGEEPNYCEIREGSWLNDKAYGVLHRIAAAKQGKGIASICVNWCFRNCGNMRGDTHQNNKSMQRIFEKNGFVKCGIICVEDGTDRIAFQKTSEKEGLSV